MAKKSDNSIPSINTPWSRDPLSGLPYSGKSVESFIKAQFNSKVGAGYFDNQLMTLYLFKDEHDKADFVEAFLEGNTRYELLVGSIPLNFETTQYRIHVIPRENTDVNATINQGEIILNMGVRAEMRELGESNWVPTGQDINVKVYVDANNTGTYEEIPDLAQTVLSSSGELSVDIFPYIPTGSSRVRFFFSAKDDATLSTSIVWNITLAEMYIEEWGNMWNEALVENGNANHYRLGGFKIVGTVAKTIHIDISTTTSVVASYSRDIGPLEAIENPYFFTRAEGLSLTSPVSHDGDALPALATGIYNVKVWLTAGNLSTEDTAITYSIMYVAPGDEYTAKLVVMNNSGKRVNNYDEAAHLCDYAVYNAGTSSGTPTITIIPYIQGTAGNTVTITSDVFSETKQALNHSINLVTNSTELTIRYRITMTDNYQEAVSAVDNSQIFPSEDGATFYLNTSLRSNGEATKQTVYNTATDTQVALSSVTWQKMSWVDGIDGWTEDEEGRKCLLLPARTRMTIPPESFRFLTGENVTFEFCYRVKNVSDYSENVITIAQNPTADGFMGIRIKPTNVTVHSGSDSTASNDVYRGTNLADEETVHLVITVQKDFGTNSGYNLVTGYVNGCKNFQFSYTTGTIWANTYANAVFGSDTADLYLYMMRVYGNKALSASGVENNWLNSLTTRAEKVFRKGLLTSILRTGSRQIDYETIKNAGKYNFFVLEMTGGASGVPSTTYPNGGRSNIEMHYGVDAQGNSRSDWDWKIYDVETKGQGTTSMNYWLWNIRWRIDKTDESKKRMVAYYDTPTISGGIKQYDELPATSSKTVRFDGNNHPPVKRITAKINFASSMQSHKMGATRAYSLLHDTLEEGALLNEAQSYAAEHSLPAPTVAVYQYPAFGFQKVVDSLGNASYSFIGLFTIGPDKGDKPTFGWDLVEDNLVSLEGTDHTPQMAKFNVPWDAQASYFVNSSGDGFLATKAPQGNYVNAFEVGNAKDADTKKAAETLPVLVDSFKDAYDVVYNNSTLICPIALDDATYGGEDAAEILANINADVDGFQSRDYDGRLSYKDMEFWIEGEYKLYHYEYETEQYVSGYKSGDVYTALNLLADLEISEASLTGMTLTQINDAFKAARRTRFKNDAPAYWDMRELVFNYTFLLIFGATDNFAKNQYPYYMGGKWRFRQDDLDTIEDIDNNGGQTKSPYIEFQDAVSGSPVFAGSNSVLWNLVHESLWSDYTVSLVDYPGIRTMGREMIDQMSELSGGNDTYDGFIKFFDKYFWGNAQEYFPQSAYNIDGNIKYEAAWLTGRQFSVDPLRQSLGDHYSAERLWVRRRAIYCMSMFGAGAFGEYRDRSLGQIQFRPNALLTTMKLTPAESMYPCLIVGANDVRPTGRTNGGSEREFTSLQGDGNTTYTLQAVHYLTSLGDLKDLQLGPDDGGLFKLSGKKLTAFKMGDADAADENVKTTVTSLNIDSNYGLPCLEEIDVRNAADLSGSLDLTNCKRLKYVYTEGTKIASVILPRGSKVEKLHLSDYVTTLSYQVVKYLSDLVLPSDASNITLIYLEECDALDGMMTLEDVYKSEGQTLAFIRLVWASEKNVTGSQIKMLAHIMNNEDKDGNAHNYNGVDQTGSGNVNIAPHIEGELLANHYYKSDLDTLAGEQEPSDSTVHDGMKRILASYFGPLYITYNTGNDYEYIEFEDKNVESVCVNAGWGDGAGITKSEAATVTNTQLGTVFRGDTTITSFDELAYFTKITTIYQYAFDGASNLTSITIPANCTLDSSSFRGTSKLATITLLGKITVNSNQTFSNSKASKRINIPNIDAILSSTLGQSFNGNNTSGTITYYINGQEVTTVDVPSTYTSIGAFSFYGCKNITSIVAPSSVTSIGSNAFSRMGSSTKIVIKGNVSFTGTEQFVSGCGEVIFENQTNINSVQLHSGGPQTATSIFRTSGNVTKTQANTYYLGTWGKYFIGGNLNQQYAGPIFGNTYNREVHIGGNINCTNSSAATLINVGSTRLKFVEVGGTITNAGAIIGSGTSSACADGFMWHFAKTDGLACSATVASVSNSRVAKVYVGDGSSEANDQAVKDMYLADADWAQYSSKLDLWYNYSGEFKETT